MTSKLQLLVTAAVIVCAGSSHTRAATPWRLEPVCSVPGFKTPESALVNPDDGTVYVSNIFAVDRDSVGALDGNGFISTLAPGGKMKDLQAVKGNAATPVHGPAGMCLFKGSLYFNDRNNLKRCPLDNPAAIEVVPVPGTNHGFNDATCDGEFVYVSGENAVFRTDGRGNGGKLVDLEGVNGVKCWRGHLFAVTTSKEKSDLYELDPAGKNPPSAFGLAPKFAGIDGIELLPDGTFLVTDCHGHKVYTVSPDRKTVTLVAEGLEYPADLGVDLDRGLVYIPQFFRNTVEVYRLKPAPDVVKTPLAKIERETRQISGWSVHVDKSLLARNPAGTARALELLKAQLEEIVRVVPTPAVAELQKVPLWISPEYPGITPRAEYHPNANWLRNHGRDPVMAHGVEFTNVRIFEAETRRMPNFALHELAHAYQDHVLDGNVEITAAFNRAKASGKYDRVECQDSKGRRSLKKAYAMTNPKEFFAETTEAFFSRNDFFPFTNAELKQHDPETFELLGKLWGTAAAPAPDKRADGAK